MSEQSEGKLKQLERLPPEGLLVDSARLYARDYYTSLLSKYVASGWLEQPARRVYRRPCGQLSWEKLVISLQTLLDHHAARRKRFAGTRRTAGRMPTCTIRRSSR
ncbi:AbiEi antitoxin N-terminal domain-containing protein [Aureimonas altamirensis]|uniref:AbiEi antitoxin N-terminal domain-containing protein n=1 Tax=Aureimonas altamirensis TaxID=370622 RepID=UPI0030B9D99D